MVQGVPYTHWKIKDAVDLSEIDPVYLWGTVIETDKGPIDTPVFCTNADQVKKIFNYDLRPFFVNGGRSVVIVRAYGGQPQYGEFKFTLDEPFSYIYVDYDYYTAGDKGIKATVDLVTSTLEDKRPQIGEGTSVPVAFSDGRWRICDDTGVIKHYYEATVTSGEGTAATESIVIKEAVPLPNAVGETLYYEEGATASNILESEPEATRKKEVDAFTKSFNESDVEKTIIAKRANVPAGASVIELKALYPGDFQVPISVQRDIRSGYRVSVKESDDFTIMLSGATTLEYISKRINERANNIKATLTSEGETVQRPFSSTLVTAVDADGQPLPPGTEANVQTYTEAVQARKLPVGAIFAKVQNTVDDTTEYSFKLSETVTYLADGSNGSWDPKLQRILTKDRLTAHKNALDHLASIKLSGIFCNYGEDDIQKVYAEHVSTTEPEGMNSAEVCKWRSLIVGANLIDRTNDIDKGETPGFKLIDKAVAFDNENILFLGQGLIDDGYTPKSNVQVKMGKNKKPETDSAGNIKYVSLLNEDKNALENQLLPFQCTQYIAGLRSKLFYGDSIFGGEDKKEVVGVGNVAIAPLFTGENKVLWQPHVYTDLNEHGVLTFTEDYNLLSLMDGVTTRQSPLEEDEEGVQSIVKYAKHAVHEVLQTYIGRNITGDLESMMNSAVTAVLNGMQREGTLTSIAQDGINAFDVDIVLVPKTNAQQTLAKAYVYLKMVPVHALRQIEVELTVQ